MSNLKGGRGPDSGGTTRMPLMPLEHPTLAKNPLHSVQARGRRRRRRSEMKVGEDSQ